MCLVGVKGAPKPLTACSTMVSSLPPDKKIDGKYDMVVDTKSPAVKKDQRGIMEFLLLNHPLDCPICDQAGECELQEYSYTYGNPASRFEFEKEHAPKRVDIGPHVVFDAERCIKCTRCIRFCNEITGTGELTLVERGVHTYVDSFPGRELDNDYSVCTVDICPVGALTSREFRFKQRVWFLTSGNSVCQECARGCSVRVDTYKGEVLRLVPRDNPQVNGPWMCDYGRLVSERLKEMNVVAQPKVAGGGRRQPLPVDGLRRGARRQAGPLQGRRRQGPGAPLVGAHDPGGDGRRQAPLVRLLRRARRHGAEGLPRRGRQRPHPQGAPSQPQGSGPHGHPRHG